jgi:hypothetical protein
MDDGGNMHSAPISMLWFDRLFFALIACNLLTIFLSLPMVEAQTAQEVGPVATYDFAHLMGALAFTFLMLMALWFLASRCRSAIAKWLITLLAAGTTLSTLANPEAIFVYGNFVALLTVSGTLLGIACIACLHVPESRYWFAEKRLRA